MQLEDYFDFLDPTDIRLKGSRIGIEHVLYEYIHRCRSPEQIARRFETLVLEQVYATILYYLHNKEAVSKYYADWVEFGLRMREEQKQCDAPFVQRMRRAKEQLRRKQVTETETV